MQPGKAADIHKFYSSSAWIEGSAEDQLTQMAGHPAVQSIAAFPDLHPGKYGPVGAAILSNNIHPQLIGNDIGCGMALFALDLAPRKIKAEKVARRLLVLEGPWLDNAAEQLEDAGLPIEASPNSVGTIGGGNHFCEVQRIADILEPDQAAAAGLTHETTYLLVHSGSRSVGTTVFTEFQDQPSEGIDRHSAAAQAYLAGHDMALRWARLNRMVIARRAARALKTDVRLICDVPHNIVEAFGNSFLHRKGAAKSDGSLVPLAGSRATLSYLLKPSGDNASALASLAHGAGRKYDRRSMHGRAGVHKSDRKRLQRTAYGGHVICEDKQLLIEEAPDAYKNSAHVLRDLETFDLATALASFEPIVTFKKANTRIGGGRR
ncbi:MAG: RNA ligase RtcB family protein [Stappiaceae bacterium]